VLTGAEEVIIAADHDFNCDSITPSVKLVLTVPPSDDAAAPTSYYDGQVHVSLKDSILQLSTPLRHAAETLEVIRLAGHEQCKVLVIRTDGGPDRNNTFVSVQLAFFALALELDLDCLILMCITSGQSFVNPVERVMSLLNLAMHGLSLERGNSGTDTEALSKNLSTMKARRPALEPNGCDERAAHRERFVTSMQVSFSPEGLTGRIFFHSKAHTFFKKSPMYCRNLFQWYAAR
jgi:hypothetical protein